MPKYLESKFTAAVEELERSKQVDYVTSAERLGLARGRKQGRKQGRVEGALMVVKGLLNEKFGKLEPELEHRLTKITVEELTALLTASNKFETSQELLGWLDNSKK
jgi:predicted transposase YdaD